MPLIGARNREAELPRAILSADRQVRLKFAGVVLLLTFTMLLAASVWLPVLLYTRVKDDERRLAQFRTEAVATQAVVTARSEDNDNGRVRITYLYNVDGAEYRTRTSVRRRDAARFPMGARVPVRYLPTDPRQSWLDGQRPRSTPVWPVFLIPLGLLAVAGLMLVPIRRQKQLLTNGRATVARVTEVRKVKGEHGSKWLVSYEWRLLSGATRASRYESTKKVPPATGSTFAILYDPDNPQRHARYPLSLVRLA